jgi:hypothetical protein
LGGFRLHRRVPVDTGLDLAVAVEFEGWSGWLMLEWLSRKHADPLCNMLKLSNVVHRGRLASFLELTSKRVTVATLAQILDKCSIYLVGPLFRDLAEADGLSFTPEMLGNLNLVNLVCLWEISERMAHLDRSTRWGPGVRTASEIGSAASSGLHFGHVTGCFVPFLTPSGIPGFGELGERLLSAVKADREVETVHAPPGELEVVAEIETPVTLPPAVVAEVVGRVHPFFTTAPRAFPRPMN